MQNFHNFTQRPRPSGNLRLGFVPIGDRILVDGPDNNDVDERGFFAEVPHNARETAKRLAKESGPKHYHGHRERLRGKFGDMGADSFADYELLELILFRSISRADTKPIAKALLQRFKSLPELFGAKEQLLLEVEGVGVLKTVIGPAS